MTRKPGDADAEGVGYAVTLIGFILVVGLTIVCAIAERPWLAVLVVGWVGSVVGAMAGAGVAALLSPISRRFGSRGQLVLEILAVAAGLAVTESAGAAAIPTCRSVLLADSRKRCRASRRLRCVPLSRHARRRILVWGLVIQKRCHAVVQFHQNPAAGDRGGVAVCGCEMARGKAD
jgi:hypothetical protein